MSIYCDVCDPEMVNDESGYNLLIGTNRATITVENGAIHLRRYEQRWSEDGKTDNVLLEHNIEQINFCPICGRPLNKDGARSWTIEHAKGVIWDEIEEADRSNNSGRWTKEYLYKKNEKEGFTEWQTDEAVAEMKEEGVLEETSCNGQTYFIPGFQVRRSD